MCYDGSYDDNVLSIICKGKSEKVNVIYCMVLDPTSAELEKKIIALRKEKSELQKKLEGM